MTTDSVEAARRITAWAKEAGEGALADWPTTCGDAVAVARALLTATAEVDRLRKALEQISNFEIDISFMADQLIWSKGLAREALSPQPPKGDAT